MPFHLSKAKRRSRLLLVTAVAVVGLAGAFSFGADRFPDDKQAESSAPAHPAGPARVEPITGTDLRRVVLTARAAERLDITTVPVRTTLVPGHGQRVVVPYAALIYDNAGETWVYTNPEPLVYVRQRIGVDRIQGDLVVLSSDPPVGTAVVTSGAAELLGIESGVGK